MKTEVQAALLAHLRGETVTTALLWTVEKRDGTLIRATDHDQDIEIPAVGSPLPANTGVYHAASNITGSTMRSTSDLAADNMEITGAVDNASQRLDVTIADIESGNLQMAGVTIFLVNWASPTDGSMLIRSGFIGDIKRNSDGEYTTELRGISSLLQQSFLRTYSERCQVRDFGDAECGVDADAMERTGDVTVVTSRRVFAGTLDTAAPAGVSYTFGVITFTSGANFGVQREIRREDEGDVPGTYALYDALPYDLEVGDTFTVRPGCDRRHSTCKAYSNVDNFRGYGIFIEGLDALMRGPNA